MLWILRTINKNRQNEKVTGQQILGLVLENAPMRQSEPQSLSHLQKIRIKEEEEKKTVQGTMGGNERDQKTSAAIMTNNRTPKLLLCITKEESRLNGPIINLLKYIYICILYIYFI